MRWAYYNEIDPGAAAWLRELIKRGLIPDGEVDTRSIEDVRPAELAPYRQCHFFAGIGGWALALRTAGWPDDREVWTGSCPCQPFSQAGKRAGFGDERHLWPAFFWLIQQRRPGAVFGEQVSGKDGLAWLDLVQADMEGIDYSLGAVTFPASGVGAPHGRHRLYFVAYAEYSDRWAQQPEHRESHGRNGPGWGCNLGELGDAEREQLRAGRPGCSNEAAARVQGANGQRQRVWPDAGEPGPTGDLENAKGQRSKGRGNGRQRLSAEGDGLLSGRPGPTNGFWRECEWLPCRDGKARPVGIVDNAESERRQQQQVQLRVVDARDREAECGGEPGAGCGENGEAVGPGPTKSRIEPLAHGVPARVVRLRGYGNAICIPQAEAFVKAYMEAWNVGKEL